MPGERLEPGSLGSNFELSGCLTQSCRFHQADGSRPVLLVGRPLGVADVTGDGVPDLVTTDHTSSVTLFEGRRDRTFAAPRTTEFVLGPYDRQFFSLRDTDGDGRSEVITLKKRDAALGRPVDFAGTRSRAEAGGWVTEPFEFPRREFMHVDGDGLIDGVEFETTGAVSTLSVYLARDLRRYEPSWSLRRDGHCALVGGALAIHCDGVVTTVRFTEGRFETSEQRPFAKPFPSPHAAISSADFDGDGQRDYVFREIWSGDLVIARGRPSGWTSRTFPAFTGVIGRANAAGRQDLIVTTLDRTVDIVEDGERVVERLRTNAALEVVAAVDFDGDGTLELILSDNGRLLLFEQ